MPIAPENLNQHLDQGLRSLYVLHGDEVLLVQEAMDAIRLRARQQGYTERHSFTVAGSNYDWSAVLAAATSQSLFGDRQLLEIHIPTAKPGKEGAQALQDLTHILQGQDACLAMIILGRLDKATKSSAWFAALEEHGVSMQIDSIERHRLAPWIARRMQQHHLRLPEGEQGQHCLQFLVEQVEGNLLAANQEVQKLALLYPDGSIDLEKIQQAVSNVARYDVFKLSEAVLAGSGLRAQKMIDGLRSEGVAEVLVHWVLSEDIRSLRRVCYALQTGKNLTQALRENRIWGAKEKIFERLAPKIKPKIMAQLLQAAYHCDGVIKGLKRPDWPTDNWQALQRLAGLMVKVALR